MNFVDWCVRVLDTIWQEQLDSGVPSMTAASKRLFRSPFRELHTTSKGEALRQAFRTLDHAGLIDQYGREGNCRIDASGRMVQANPSRLWQNVVSRQLTPHEEELLRFVNRKTHRQASEFAWIESGSFDDLRAWSVEVFGSEAATPFSNALLGLQRMSMVATPTSGEFHATFDGIAWEVKANPGEGPTSKHALSNGQEKEKVDSFSVFPIIRGRRNDIDPSLCFVLMPFNTRQDKVYKSAIEPAIREVGLKAVRADNIHDIGNITEQIWDYICRARVIVADLADRNPNVYYEVGLADVVGRPVILLQPDDGHEGFDVRHRRQVRYSRVMGSETALKTELILKLQAVLA